MPLEEEETRALEESPIPFRLSGPNERLSQHEQSDEDLKNSGDSAVQSPRPKPRRRLTHKEKGKKKKPEYDTGNTPVRTSRIEANLTPQETKTGLRK